MAVFVRKILAILIACLLCAPAALAEEAALSGDFERLAEETGAEWQEDGAPDLWALELGEASLHVCLREGEIVAATVKAPLGEGSAELIRAAIEPLGWLDEAALTALGRLSNGSSEASNGFVYGLIEGETREAFWVCPEAEFDALVWQPVHGGEKYHDSPTCSTMDVPRLVTVEAAEAAGFSPCGNCME